MPITPTFPGVYIQEIPSGVRTITGVATSITAFLGLAKRGPVNKAVHIFSLKDYENNFGGLSTDSAMSYAVNQFFLNGGNEAWVVRLAKNAKAASLDLKDRAQNVVITITAVDEGDEGNNIQVAIADHSTEQTISSGRFNLLLSYTPKDNTADSRIETFKGLSMDSQDARFVEDVINDVSQLLTVKVKEASSSGGTTNTPGGGTPQSGTNPNVPVPTGSTALAATIPNPPAPLGLTAGTLTSGKFESGQLDSLPDASHSSFMIGFDGHPADLVTLDTTSPLPAGTLLADQLQDMADRIQKAVRAKKQALPAWSNFTCQRSHDNTALVLTSGTTGDNSAVLVTDAPQNNIADKLHLDKGGTNGATTSVGGTPHLGEVSTSKGSGDTFDLNNGSDVLFPTDGSRTGIFALDEVDLFNLLCLPAVTNAGILNQAVAYCKGRRAFMIVDPDPSLDRAGMVKFITDPNLTKADLGTYAAIYFPWIKAPDPLHNGKLRSFPPSGMIAGLYARTDNTRGVWKAPAGTEATMVNVRGMDFLLTDGENGSLNPLGVNCLRIFPVYGAVCWGARTVSGADELASEYKYVPIRRLALYIEESLYRGTKWVVFEPNDDPLWAQIRLNVGAFMHDLFRKGAFQGQTPKDAYFVKCDKETTTQNDINLGVVNIVVGFAPLKPAEFVVIQLQQIAGDIQV